MSVSLSSYPWVCSTTPSLSSSVCVCVILSVGVWYHSNSECSIGNDFVKMSLYRKYVHVMVGLMNSPIVKEARMYGWCPLFLMKNILLASTKWNGSGMHFTSIDTDARTSIMVIGFWRMRSGLRENLEVLAFTEKRFRLEEVLA